MQKKTPYLHLALLTIVVFTVFGGSLRNGFGRAGFSWGA